MRPSKSMTRRSNKDLDLKALWEALGEEPPGPIIEIESKAARAKSRTAANGRRSER